MEADDDIQRVFDRIAKKFEGADEGAREIFSMLVSTTLRYRDLLMHSGGKALTVAETKEALDAFMQVMQTRAIPPNLVPRVHDLVIMWLEEIRQKIHN